MSFAIIAVHNNDSCVQGVCGICTFRPLISTKIPNFHERSHFIAPFPDDSLNSPLMLYFVKILNQNINLNNIIFFLYPFLFQCELGGKISYTVSWVCCYPLCQCIGFLEAWSGYMTGCLVSNKMLIKKYMHTFLFLFIFFHFLKLLYIFLCFWIFFVFISDIG